ncbi:MAG: sterol desaturase family protein [Bacteroidetes bacterium]|nr:sterol desaturase family protein [Bacteroidota bacterium]
MPQFPNLLTHAIPAFILLIIVEVIFAVKTQRELYEVKDTATSITLGLGNLFSGILTKTLILFVFYFLYQYRIFTIPWNAWWAWVLIFFADDLSYYWFHRISHSVRFFWASHVVHHSSEKYNLAAALRQTWTGNITGSFLFWSWMPLVGFEPAMIMTMQAVSLLYQFWIHTESIGKMPRWFESVFNTPSHHRVHHGTDLIYLDKNHAGILIIWDKFFGTFQEEKFRPKYGLTKNVHTFNPVYVAFHEWRNMALDLRKAKNWKQVFHIVFDSPGWSADGSTKTTKQLRKEQINSSGK